LDRLTLATSIGSLLVANSGLVLAAFVVISRRAEEVATHSEVHNGGTGLKCCLSSISNSSRWAADRTLISESLNLGNLLRRKHARTNWKIGPGKRVCNRSKSHREIAGCWPTSQEFSVNQSLQDKIEVTSTNVLSDVHNARRIVQVWLSRPIFVCRIQSVTELVRDWDEGGFETRSFVTGYRLRNVLSDGSVFSRWSSGETTITRAVFVKLTVAMSARWDPRGVVSLLLRLALGGSVSTVCRCAFCQAV